MPLQGQPAWHGQPHPGQPSRALRGAATKASVVILPRLCADEGRSAGFGAGHGQKSMPHIVAKRRKKGVFVAFVQLVLLLVMLGGGYAIWLAINDPAGV